MSQRALGYLLRELRAKHCRDLTDGELLERFCATREEAAFGLLVHRHGPMVFAVCRRILHNVHDAEDAFQATFLVLVQKACSIRKRASLGSWLHGVARRVAVRAKEQTATRRERDLLVSRGTSSDPVDYLIELEWRTLLDEEISRLPDKYRAAVVLCCLEGKSLAQAAEELGWPKSSLASRLDRALCMLKERLNYRGVHIPGSLAGTLLTAAPSQVPAVLTLNIVRAATQTMLGARGAISAISPQVVGLADGAVAAISVSKLKVLLLCALLLASTGGALLAHVAAMGNGGLRERAQASALNPAREIETTPEPQKRADSYGDPLPAGAIARLGTEHYRAAPRNWLAAFDAAGKTYVAESDGAVILSGIQTGKALRRFPMPGGVYAAAISPDGKTVAAGGGPTYDMVRIWDTLTGRELRQFKTSIGSTGQVLLFNPDGTTLARYDGSESSCLWNLVTGKEIWKHSGADRRSILSPRAFSADGKILFATEDHARQDAVVLIEAASGQELRRIKGVMPNWALAISDDRKLIASLGENFALHFRDMATGKKLRDVFGLRSTGEQLAFSPSGKMLACSSAENCVRLVDVAAGKEVRLVAKGVGFANRLKFLDNDSTIAFSLWNESALRVWDLEREREIYPTGGHRGRIYDTLFCPDGKTLISAGMDNTIRYWDIVSGKELHHCEAHTGGVWAMTITPDGKILASSGVNDKGIRLWDTGSHTEIGRLGAQEAVHDLAFFPDGKKLLSSSLAPDGDNPLDKQRRNVLRLWDSVTGKELRHWDTTGSGRCPIAISPDGKLVASENGSHLVVWDALSGRVLRRLLFPSPSDPGNLIFSADGRTLVSAKRDGRYKDPQSAVVFWELASGKARLSIKLAAGRGKTLSFSTNGKCLAVGGFDKTVHVIDTDTGEIMRRLPGHHGDIGTVTFSPDGKTLATGSADTTILIWDLADLPGRDRKPSRNLSNQELSILWDSLAEVDATKAYRAIVTMARSSQTAPYLAKQLKPVAPANPERVAQLVADLDSTNYGTREKAASELALLGELVEPALRDALAKKPSLEFQRRVEGLFRKLDEPVTSPDVIRSLRALEVLERIATPEALEVLQTVAAGAPASRITQGAQDALKRLAR